MTYRDIGGRKKANWTGAAVPQSQPLPGQTLNNTGIGYSWKVTDEVLLDRFLKLGIRSGTYYVTDEKTLGKDALVAVIRLIKAGKGKYVVDQCVEVAEQGLAISADPVLFTLACCLGSDFFGRVTVTKAERTHRFLHPKTGRMVDEPRKASVTKNVLNPADVELRQYAALALPKVARIGTDLLHFASFTGQFRGDGTTLRRALRSWYENMDAEKLAYQLIKYQSRDKWSQGDVMRVSHVNPKIVDTQHAALYHWATKGWDGIGTDPHPDAVLARVWAFEKAKRSFASEEDGKRTVKGTEVAQLIRQYRLPREAVPTEALALVEVWEALLEQAPVGMLTRNLATLTKNGTLVSGNKMTKLVVNMLTSGDIIQKARLHPIKILSALNVYRKGHGERSKATWEPLPEITAALANAYELSYKNVTPTGLRICVAADISGSMQGTMVNGIPGFSAWMACAGLQSIIVNTEPHATAMTFHTEASLFDARGRRVDDIVKELEQLPGGGTDIASPIQLALHKKLDFDVIVLCTDNETWAGRAHAVTLLNDYRKQVGHRVKLINVQATATDITNNDPNDGDMIEVAGFSANVPLLISKFAVM